MNRRIRHVMKAAALVGLFSLIFLGLVARVQNVTRDRIEANEKSELLRRLGELIPPGDYDNDILNDTANVFDALLGTGPSTVYRARKGGHTVAAALTAAAADGYGGVIRLLVAVRSDGRLAGVRVISHKETPGLGDPIDVEKSDWILGFTGRSLQNPVEGRWAVKKDGGDFDQFTGATITPRAVVRAVRAVLIYVRDYGSEIFGEASN